MQWGRRACAAVGAARAGEAGPVREVRRHSLGPGTHCRAQAPGLQLVFAKVPSSLFCALEK